MQGISAAMIVRNEAARLRSCLASLAGVVDEVVVADTGSSDGTRAVADAAGARRIDFLWCDDFAAARNAALQHVTNPWVLVIDADEQVRDGARAGDALRRFVMDHDGATMGTVAIVSPTEPGPGAPVVTDHTLRFFHRDSVRYEGCIHEQPVHVSGQARSAPTGIVLDHSGYALPASEAREKAKRNLVLLRKVLSAHPDDEYFLFQLGKTQQMLGLRTSALTAFRKGLASIHFAKDKSPMGRMGPVGRSVLTGLVVNLAYALVNAKRLPEAVRLVEEHAALAHEGTQCADFDHARGYVHLMQGDLVRSRAAYEASMRRGAAEEDVEGTGTYASAYHLGLLDEADHDVSAALNHYLLSLSFKPDYEKALARCVDLVAENGIALPKELVVASAPMALEAAFRQRLDHYLREGNMGAVTRLAHGVAAVPALQEICRGALRAYDKT